VPAAVASAVDSAAAKTPAEPIRTDPSSVIRRETAPRMEVVRADGAPRGDAAKPDGPRNEAAGTIDSKVAGTIDSKLGKQSDPSAKN